VILARVTDDLEIGESWPELGRRLDEELTRFNNAAVGADDDRPMSVRITDAEGGLLGGLTGWTWGGVAGVSMVWVRDDQRGRGLGARLMAAAEAEARARGCTRVILSSFTFQAPGFYMGLGYTETGRWPGFPAGAEDVHFTKRLS
jgi:GNAT superfamily N-acetyltransferase